MRLSARDALLAMELATSFALCLQSIELLRVGRALGPSGVFRWETLRKEYAAWPRPVRAVLDASLAHRPFVLLMWMRLGGALALPFVEAKLLAPVLLLLTLLTCVRFRGTFNGGSDYMTVVLLLSLSVARVGPDTLWASCGLAYAAAQLTLSYFVAGLSKARTRAWRSGEALAQVFASTQYGAPTVRIAPSPPLLRLGAWGVMIFECAFPAAWLGALPCAALLTVALAFHLANAWLLGLNRFVWAWLAAYPSLLYWTLRPDY